MKRQAAIQDEGARLILILTAAAAVAMHLRDFAGKIQAQAGAVGQEVDAAALLAGGRVRFIEEYPLGLQVGKFLIALVAVASRLPWLVFTLPAGVITDRFDRRKIIVAMDSFRGLLALVVAVTVTVEASSLVKLDEIATKIGRAHV